MGVVDYLASGDKSFAKERRRSLLRRAHRSTGTIIGRWKLVHNGQRRTVKINVPARLNGHFNEMQAFRERHPQRGRAAYSV